MTLVGHLHYRANPENAKSVYAYAAAAKAEGIEYVYFTPRRVDLETETINGFIYEDGKWVEQRTRLPDAILNESTRSDKYWPVVQALQERIPFTSHPIGDKLSVYERMYRAKKYRSYLIPSKELDDVNKDLSVFLHNYGKVIVKPLWGAKGQGVMMVERNGRDYYYIVENGVSKVVSLSELLEIVTQRHEENPQLLQKYIACLTKSGQPYDFRLHVQKNGNGKWEVPAMYCRVARPGNITANLSSGGFTSFTNSFLQYEFDDNNYNMQCYLQQLGLQLASHMDEIYEESFDELGIDVGIDAMRKAWIYEVNWKPGSPPNHYLELDVPRNSVLYAAYLASNTDRAGLARCRTK